MTPAVCDTLRPLFGAFVDDELLGPDRQKLAQHLEVCDRCGDEIAELRSIGLLLREAAAVEPPTPQMSGLAGGVVARIAAESAQSWRALFSRAVEDWHWVIVGGGAVAATFVSMVLVSALLLFGPAPRRPDSLSALVTNLKSPAGTLLIEASQKGNDQSITLWQVENGSGTVRRVIPVSFEYDAAERALVSALADVVAASGRLVELSSMPEVERRYTERLLDEISRRRVGEPEFGGKSNQLNVVRIHLVTSTGVTAKSLVP